jgi:type IV pilus assembly protein PilM
MASVRAADEPRAGSTRNASGLEFRTMLERLQQPITFRRKPAASAPDDARRSGRPARAARVRSLVGLEIEAGQLVAAKSRINGHVVVEKAIGKPIAPNIVRDGEVTDVEALTGELAELFAGSGLDRRVRIGIANQRIVMRQIELPPILDPKELDSAVRFRAQDEIPMPIESVVLDYHSLGVVEVDGSARMRVLLVAARRDMVERVLLAARRAGLRPEGVDLAAFGMIRALRPMDVPETDRVLYLSIGGITNIAIATGATCEFTRSITSGIDHVVAEVAARTGVPFADARRSLAAVSESVARPRPVLLAPTEPHPGVAGIGRGETAADGDSDVARAELADGIRRIASEVRNSLDFHLGAHGENPIARVVLTGPALDLPGFDTALGRELGLEITRGEVALGSPSAAGQVPISRLAVAAGLSVAEGPK